MNLVLHRKLAGYALLATVGLFAGTAADRPELVLLGVPFALALIAGLSAVRKPDPKISATLSAERLLEGDTVNVNWQINSVRPLGHLELTMSLPEGLRPVGGFAPLVTLDINQSGVTTAMETLEAARWGRWSITQLAWQVLDPGRFVTYEGILASSLVVQVHPTPEHLREIVNPMKTAISTGTHTARDVGEGIEFADIRPFSPGEHVRGVNWRATARHGGELWVNTQHLDRNSDIVLLVDTLTEESMVIGVRAALRLATAYASQRDRIGVISFGGMLRWIEPGAGIRHLYRVLDALLLTTTAFSYVWADPSVVPPRTMPPGSLVLAISPLDDERAFAAIRDLRYRGIDLVVIEVEPPTLIEPGQTRAEQVAYRLWRLHREGQRLELRGLGVPVVAWADDRPLAATLAEIASFRRGRRRRVG